MTTTAENLLVRIDATTEQLRREMRRGEQNVAQNTGRMNRSLRNVDSSFTRLNRTVRTATRLMGVFGAALSVRALQRHTMQTFEMADSLEAAANTAGVGVESVQELRFAFGELANVTDNQVDEALRRFNRRLGEAANGSAQYRDALDDLGIQLDQDTEPALEQVLESLGEIESGSDRARIAARLFGETVGPQLAAAVDDGGRAVRQLRQDARELGLVLDEDLIRGASETSNQISRMRNVMGARFQRLVLDNADNIDTLTQALSRVGKAAFMVVEGWSLLFETLDRGDDMRMDSLERRKAAAKGTLEIIEEQRDMLREMGPGDDQAGFDAQMQRLDQQAAAAKEQLREVRAEMEKLREQSRPSTSEGDTGGGGPVSLDPLENQRPGELSDLERQIEEQQRLNRALGQSREQYRMVRREIEIANEANEFRNQLVDDEMDNVDALVDEYTELLRTQKELEDEQGRLKEGFRDADQFARDFAAGMSSAMEEAIIKMEDFRSILKGALEDIATPVVGPVGNVEIPQ